MTDAPDPVPVGLVGTDWSPDMVALAVGRDLPGATVQREDVRALSSPDGRFELVHHDGVPPPSFLSSHYSSAGCCTRP